MLTQLKNRNFLKLLDYGPEEITALVDFAAELKQAKEQRKEKQYLKGLNIALIFEKASTRTRCSFEVAAFDQGAHTTYLGPSGSQISTKESIADTARVLSRMYDGIQYRGYAQSIVEELAAHSRVPVWNGLTTEFHPTQILADLLTIKEHLGRLQNVKIVYCGDGRNNVANSLMVGCAMMGMDVRIASPRSLYPTTALVKTVQDIAAKTGGKITISDDIAQACHGAEVVYTDVWVSMGESQDTWKERIDLLSPYQVNEKLCNYCTQDFLFLHCLPAFHNTKTTVGADIYNKFGLEAMEVSDDIFESSHSVVFDQAENRMHTIKSVMVNTLNPSINE